jgi:hypothetical protein
MRISYEYSYRSQARNWHFALETPAMRLTQRNDFAPVPRFIRSGAPYEQKGTRPGSLFVHGLHADVRTLDMNGREFDTSRCGAPAQDAATLSRRSRATRGTSGQSAASSIAERFWTPKAPAGRGAVPGSESILRARHFSMAQAQRKGERMTGPRTFPDFPLATIRRRPTEKLFSSILCGGSSASLRFCSSLLYRRQYRFRHCRVTRLPYPRSGPRPFASRTMCVSIAAPKKA